MENNLLQPPFHGLRSSDCSSQTSSITITWKLVRNANSQAHSRPAESETLEVGPSSLGFHKATRGFCFENYWYMLWGT